MIPYYKGNIKLTKVIGHVKLYALINAIQNPKPEILEIIRKVRIEKDKLKKRLLKHQLFSFTVSVHIEYWKGRSYQNISSFTGLIQLDFDNVKEDLEELKIELYNKPYIICVFYSPSGNGLKAIGRIKKAKNVEQYKAIWRAVKADLNKESFDNATKNPLLPMFISSDPNIYFKHIDDVEVFDKEEVIATIEQPLNLSESKFKPNRNNLEKTIRIFKTKVQGIQENGHPQLRDACLIIGGRAAANYISFNEALALAKHETINNPYFKKGLSGYLKTVEWALKHGYNNGAKYY